MDVPGNLPPATGRFVGRQAELAAAGRLPARARLLTLTGPGGVGKTRLALRLAARAAAPDGAWLVELAGLHDPELLAPHVAAALGVASRAGADVPAALVAHLAEREPLLVLDGAEHLLDACAALLARLLPGAPELRVLVTSREPLRANGEHVLPVPPLPGPDALDLFVERATAARPDLVIDGPGRRRAAEVVARLDGIPLAIELAAVRLRTMPLDALADGLADRFALLGAAGARPGRHRTLRDTVAWSHRLCAPAERELWARLSVFAGTFDLTAAEQVCGDGLEVLDALAGLVDKSVVQAEPGPGGVRYRMLDTLRDFGAEHLAGDLRPRHLAWFRDLAARAGGAGMSTGRDGWPAPLAEAHGDLRAALEHALAADPGAAMDLAGSLWAYWTAQGLLREGLHWTGRVLALPCPPSAARARVLGVHCLLALLQQDEGTARAAERELWAAAAALPGDGGVRAHAHQAAAHVRFYADDLDTVPGHLEAAIALHRAAGHDEALPLLCLVQLSAVRTLTGDPDAGRELAEECRRRCAEHGDRWLLSYALWTRGLACWIREDVEGVVADVRACLRVKRDLRDLLGIAMSVDVLGGCALVLGDAARAAVLMGATEPLWRYLGAPIIGPRYLALRGGALTGAREALGAAAFGAALAEGAALGLEEACRVALGEPAGTPPPLTRREREVALLVAGGLTNRDVAERLSIARRTVDAHLARIFAKLGVHDRAQVAARLAGAAGGEVGEVGG
ncbi:ATP-binding protein [Actinomadura parmotrematis]|uniref:LuxR C-terminal-related transcriptional regulator n=1 Tax=Actinomadura parmotrematis TaxID=2864039 RepID=A0ABS7FU45_9ACTN|nr:LuxR C-terminal-related transcriptional regulator [Actinomadura parmotrematis]MBW8483715.1 LuxR C-terminal-related transcriptional regulator [Actinomadura parmotrematis]